MANKTLTDIVQVPVRVSCTEDNPWNPILPRKEVIAGTDIAHLGDVKPESDDLVMTLEQLDPLQNRRVIEADKLVFHVLGCSGDAVLPLPQDAVAAALVSQLGLPDTAAFMYHLGDIAYKPKATAGQTDPTEMTTDLGQLFNNEFYEAYRMYEREIVSVPGNHDGKYHPADTAKIKLEHSPMYYFLRNFCAKQRGVSPDNLNKLQRRTMTQPYPYFLLDTPFASIIGLYTNVLNGGQLDSPAVSATGKDAVQFQWLVRTLKRLAREKHRKPILIMLHYPPLSGAANFRRRGAPDCPTTPEPRPNLGLASILFRAFELAEIYPDAVVSAHAHLYQRIHCEVSLKKGSKTIPFWIVGNGGHAPVESLWTKCSGEPAEPVTVPFPVVIPKGTELPDGVSAQVRQYNDSDFGFLRITINRKKLVGEFFAVYPLSNDDSERVPTRHDAHTVAFDFD